jgi:putative heme-binding domain-containing protein
MNLISTYLRQRMMCLAAIGLLGDAIGLAQETLPVTWKTKTVQVEQIPLTIPEFCSIEKVSSDELCTWPIVATLAPDGSLVIAESVWNIKSKETVQQQLVSRPHRIIRLRDTNKDGRFDQRQVVAEQLSFPEGVLCIGRDIYVTAPPEIWKLTDSDGDGTCEKREVWFDGTTLTGCANDLHGPWLGPDGWIYWSKAAFAEQSHEILSGKTWKSKASHLYRRHPDGGPIDPVMTGGMDNLVDIAWLPNGDRFFCATFLHHPRHGFRDGIGAATYGSVFGKPHAVLDGHPRTGPLMEPTVELGPAAPAGLMFLDSIAQEISRRELGYLLCAQFNLHQISLHPLDQQQDRADYRAMSVPVVSSDRIDFHPVDLLKDSDGSILIVDTGGWYDLCCPSSGTDQRVATGGIYRLRGLSLEQPSSPSSPGLRALSELAVALTRAPESKRASLAANYQQLVLASMDAHDPAVAILACHMASLHRMQAARNKATELLSSPNASFRRSAAELLGRIGIDKELPIVLEQINNALADRTLTHSLIYALIEGAQDQALLQALDAAVQAQQALPSTAALVRVLEDRGKLAEHHGDLVLQLALAEHQDTSALGVGVLEAHPQWSSSILGAVSDRMHKSKQPPSDSLLELLARWSENPTVAQWVADELLSNHASATSILSRLASKPVPSQWITPIANLLERSNSEDSQETIAWQNALRNRVWKGDTQTVQKAIVSIQRKIKSSDQPVEDKQRLLVAWAAALPKGSAVDESIQELLIQRALAQTDPNANDSQTRRQAAWQAFANVQMGSESSKRSILSRIANAGPLELPVAIEAYLRSGTPAQDIELLERLPDLPTSKTLSVDAVMAKLKDRPAEVQKRWKEVLDHCTRPDQDVQDKVQQWLEKLKQGDPKQGYHVFRSTKAACSACHQVGYVGGNIGPVLSKIGQSRSRRDLLEAILFPSARLEQAYRSTKILLQDGEVVQGLVVSETPKEILLQTAADKRLAIAVDQIELREPSGISIMPAGLESQLSIEELSDLIAFLENTK